MAANLQKINAKSVAKYVLLPGIIPRAQEFATSGFAYLAFLFACVYRAVRILPPTHPYVNPDNIGKFGIVKVIAAAADNVQVNRKNADQIIVFLALLAAVILMFMQFILLLLAIFSGRAFAASGSPDFKSMFVTENPQTDIAFLMLDYVFGIPSGASGGTSTFFGSNALVATNGPTPFHEGMHALFNFYNLAILLVAVLIFLYYVFVVVVETAQTGVPFGQRFAKLYAPFRLIAAVGMLVPLNYGFNGAQYITLYAAKLGSSFATNGWILFNNSLTNGDTQNPLGAHKTSLVAKARSPAIDELVFFSSIYHACREAYKIGKAVDYANPSKGGREIKPYVIVKGQAKEFLSYDYATAKKEFTNAEMEVVLGEENTEEHKSFAGGVRPYCGRITISMTNDNPVNFTDNGSGSGNASASPKGVRAVESMYYGTVQALLRPDSVWAAFGERSAQVHSATASSNASCYESGTLGDGSTCETNWNPPASTFTLSLKNYQTSHDVLIQTAFQTYRDGLNHALPEELKKRGWGGAGIWYNAIADVNGVFTSAMYAAPSVRRYPEVMEEVKKQRQMQNAASGACEMFEANIGNDKSIKFQETGDASAARAMNGAYIYFACGTKFVQDKANTTSGGTSNTCDNGYQVGTTGKTDPGAGVFINIVGLIFGINGLFDIRCNSEMDAATGQARVHPLAQLSTVGRSLVENSIRSMGMAVGAAFGAGIAGVLAPSLGAALQSASGMFVGIATIGLTAGFILYYILPFLPFIYFFFAVGSWVKSIFEAMVGVPLWALAHLRIDGDGFSGRAAAGGYFMIFEIFLRPIFTIFGLLGGMAVFGALAVMLNQLFDLVTMNITGALPGASGSSLDVGKIESLRRGVIDQFFFTIMYTILLYMMATSSFKMIDTIPKGVMRWIGSNVSTFNDNKGDPTSNLTQYTAIAGSQITPQILEGVTGGARSVGQLGGSLIGEMTGANKQQT